MYLTGFADEAALDLDGQIRATKTLGWSNIESRNIDGTNLHDLSDEAFDVVVEKLNAANVKINCFGSAIANWAKHIDQPFDDSLAEIKRSIPRMQRLDTKLIRIMSFALLKDRAADDQLEEERFKRLREIVALFNDAGLTPVHENCMNYGGMSAECTLKLLDNVPGLKLVYDTGNPVFTQDRSKSKPYPLQSSWEFYSKVKDHIAYIHIKDGTFDTEKNITDYCYPGEGDGDTVRIVEDLIRNDYDGGISIEPHMGAVFHDESITCDKEKMFAMYVEYGRRMEKIIADARNTISA